MVTGGCGFIGSHVVDALVERKETVKVYDNLRTGRQEFIQPHLNNRTVQLVKADLLDNKMVNQEMRGCDTVFHMAANADVREGLKHPSYDTEQNTLPVLNVLDAMRKNDVKTMVFPSTGSIYGEPEIFPTPEDAPFPVQTSLYGAAKLASEGLIHAFCEGYGMKCYIFRFVSIVGERYTHGVIFDFINKLLANPKELHMFGNGLQEKSYLYVKDCVDAMFLALEKSNDKVNTFNLGREDTKIVNFFADTVTDEMSIKDVKYTYEGGVRGWIGDSPKILLDTKKIKSLGWEPKVSIEEGIRRTVRYLLANKHFLEKKI